MHCLIMQDCFMRPGPPNFFMSLQKWHSPHSVRMHASHFRQRVLLRLAPDELRLDGSLTAEGVAILGFGRLVRRFNLRLRQSPVRACLASKRSLLFNLVWRPQQNTNISASLTQTNLGNTQMLIVTWKRGHRKACDLYWRHNTLAFGLFCTPRAQNAPRVAVLFLSSLSVFAKN